jgi:hypothetical protein
MESWLNPTKSRLVVSVKSRTVTPFVLVRGRSLLTVFVRDVAGCVAFVEPFKGCPATFRPSLESFCYAAFNEGLVS